MRHLLAFRRRGNEATNLQESRAHYRHRFTPLRLPVDITSPITTFAGINNLKSHWTASKQTFPSCSFNNSNRTLFQKLDLNPWDSRKRKNEEVKGVKKKGRKRIGGGKRKRSSYFRAYQLLKNQFSHFLFCLWETKIYLKWEM